MKLALMDAVKCDEDLDPGGGPIWANVGFFWFRSALPFLESH
jgi:hypothetical protein